MPAVNDRQILCRQHVDIPRIRSRAERGGRTNPATRAADADGSSSHSILPAGIAAAADVLIDPAFDSVNVPAAALDEVPDALMVEIAPVEAGRVLCGGTGMDGMDVEIPGGKFNLTDINASIGLGQLPRLMEITRRRAELAGHGGHDPPGP